MPVTVSNLCLDVVDAERLATFWSAALGWQRATDEDVDPDDDSEIWLEPGPDSPDAGRVTPLLLLKVPEPHATKNRLHLDLRPDDQAAEVARLEELGATKVDIGQGPDVTWVVLADPEGNEFCVLRALRPTEVG
jgi:predicted enzyme related to lactoylglutathione lyase